MFYQEAVYAIRDNTGWRSNSFHYMKQNAELHASDLRFINKDKKRKFEVYRTTIRKFKQIDQEEASYVDFYI